MSYVKTIDSADLAEAIARLDAEGRGLRGLSYDEIALKAMRLCPGAPEDEGEQA